MLSRFGLMEDGRVVADSTPMPLVFDKGSWVEYKGTFGPLMLAKPIAEADAMRLTSGKVTAGSPPK